MFLNDTVITEEEVKKHCTKESLWIILDGLIYDVTNWQKKHPGGARIINHYAGQDASDAWKAMHPDIKLASRYLTGLQIGRLSTMDNIIDPDLRKKQELLSDFHELKKRAEDNGFMDANFFFYFFHLSHIIIFECLAYLLAGYYGNSCLNFLLVAGLLVIAQAQCGWSQHDYGHLSVFKSSKLNHYMHYFIICHMKGASSHWWNFRHYQHHVKPNVFRKDPDITVAKMFVLGDVQPSVLGSKKKGSMPYQWQHLYFWLIGPPTLLPLYFHVENLFFVFKRKDWVDLFWMVSFFVRFFYMYGPIMGGWGTFGLYMFVRFIESYWFVLVTQMNHIPMEIDQDHKEDWVTMQFKATCNVEGSFFNDWFTGGLNYQIEHHLFPTMPRHNLPKVAPLVKEMSEKHGLKYVEKSLIAAMVDIHKSLQRSGQLWWKAYNAS